MTTALNANPNGYGPATGGGSIAMNDQTMSATDLLRVALAANRSALLMGAPGTAKTAIIEAMAAEAGATLEVLIASAQDPTTILGIPMPSEDRKRTEPTIPGWARRINEAHDRGEQTWLFVDEVTTLPPAVVATLLSVVQSRRADGWTLPAETRIVAAANPPDLAVGGWALDPAMANRWAHIEWPAPTAEWLAWAKSQSSPALKLIAGYIEAVPEDLLSVPRDTRARSAAWPSPRSWSNGAALMDAAGGNPAVLALTVGANVAESFARWARERDMPTVEAMLDGTAAIPDRPDAMSTALSALVEAATEATRDRTIALLIGAVAVDAALVANAATRLAERGHIQGIAPLRKALADAGIGVRTAAR